MPGGESHGEHSSRVWENTTRNLHAGIPHTRAIESTGETANSELRAVHVENPDRVCTRPAAR